MSTTPSVPVRASSAPPVDSSASSPRWRGLLTASLPRTVGYGLFILFGLDVTKMVVEFAQNYAGTALPLALHQASSKFAAELIERAGVPLVAYALVFMDTRSLPSRASRAARKILSWFALLAIPGFLALAVLSAYSGTRLVSAVRAQRNLPAAQIDAWRGQLAAMSPQEVIYVFSQVAPSALPRLAKLSAAETKAELGKILPAARAEAVTQFETAQPRAVRAQVMFTAKYVIGGALLALIMLLIAEGTRAARNEPVFSDGRHAPNLRLEDAVARGVGKSVRAIEGFGDFILPDFNGWRWYRRLKRWLRREK